MRRLAIVIPILLLALAALLLGGALMLFDPPSPPHLAQISAPFERMDYSTLPAVSRYAARDGAQLAYRAYPGDPAAPPRGAIVLVHGSSGSGRAMHALGPALARAGYSAYALDMRGHGESGARGDIAYIGQLEDDLEDFMARVLPERRDVVLAGHSSGGGFALRFAAGARQALFARYVLLAPYLAYDAPTLRPANGWAAPNVPRIVALSVLGELGAAQLGHLPVVRFAGNPARAQYQTLWYSYRLWANFGPHRDYAADLRAARQRMDVLVGAEDELFYANAYAPLLQTLRPASAVTVVPGASHITLITAPEGARALVDLLGR